MGGGFLADFVDCRGPVEDDYCMMFVQESDFFRGVFEWDAKEDVLSGKLLEGSYRSSNDMKLFADVFDD